MDPTIIAFARIQREITKSLDKIESKDNKLIAIQLAENTLREAKAKLTGGK